MACIQHASSRSGRAAPWWLLGLLLGLIATVRVGALVLESTTPVELGGAARLAPDALLVEAIEAHQTPVFATLYLSEPDAMPSSMRRLEDDLVRLFGGLERATKGRIAFAIVHPSTSAQARSYAAARGIAERRVRTVLRDGWTEALVYSTIELKGGGGRSVLIEGLAPDELGDLQRRMAAHLELLATPSTPRIALAAPELGSARLAGLLAQRGEVVRVDLADRAEQLDGFDLVVWIAPTPAQLASGALLRVEARRAAGTAVVVAAGRANDELDLAATGGARVTLATRDDGLAALWNAFALGVRGAPLLDERCEQIALPGSGAPLALPFLVRAIAPNQDFRRFDGQPNSTLLFPSPSALVLDEARLLERGWRAHILATSSELSFAPRRVDGDVALAELVQSSGQALPKSPLIVELEPERPLEGPLFVAASERVFADDLLARTDLGQRRALELIVQFALRDERLVAARGAFVRSPSFQRPARADELAWRSIALLAAPLLVFVALRLRRTLVPRAQRQSGPRRGLVPVAAGLIGALLVAPFVAGVVRSDQAPPAELVQLTRRCAERAAHGLAIDLVLSPAHTLPADVRAAAREARARLERLADGVPGVRVNRVDTSALSDEQRAASPVAERTLVRIEGGRTVARRIRAGVVVRGLEGEPLVVELEDASAFDQLEFRLGNALWSALEGRRAVVELAASAPRLSAAEAHTEFQARQLFAPTGSDVFSAARALLVRSGFDVVHIQPEDPHIAGTSDAFVWLQPRRPVTALLPHLVEHLRAGRGAIVAGQPFELVARQNEESELELVHWPRPTSSDLDELWFKDVGATVERSLLLDRVVFASAVDVRTRSAARGDVTTRGASAPAFQVRSGDLAWYGGSPLALDSARLESFGLSAEVLMRASPRAWAFAWEGGYVPVAVLAGPSEQAPARPNAPLVARITGTFPLIDEHGAAILDSAAGAKPGTLVLVGSAELFADGRLLDPRFGAPEFLVENVARLALPAALADLAAANERPRRLGDVDESARLFWRGAAWVAAPLIALVLALMRLGLRTLARRRRGAWA